MNEQDYEQLTLFQEDSHASPFPLPGSDEARRMTVTSGLKCCALSKSCDPLGLLEKMLLGSSIWRSTRCYLTWKPSATPAGRLLYQLAVSMPRTDGTDARLWLGTMTASQTGGNHSLRSPERRKGRTPSPAEYVRMFPTPTSRDYKDGTAQSCRNVPVNGLLGRAVHMWPTPRRNAGTGPSNAPNRQGSPDLQSTVGGKLNPTWVEWLMGFPLGWTDLNA